MSVIKVIIPFADSRSHKYVVYSPNQEDVHRQEANRICLGVPLGTTLLEIVRIRKAVQAGDTQNKHLRSHNNNQEQIYEKLGTYF